MTKSPAYTLSIRLKEKDLRKRAWAEWRFRYYGLITIGAVFSILLLLIGGILFKGYTAFVKSEILLSFDFNPKIISYEKNNSQISLRNSDLSSLILDALHNEFSHIQTPEQLKEIIKIVSPSAMCALGLKLSSDPSLIGARKKVWVLASDKVDQFLKNKQSYLTSQEIAWVTQLKKQGKIRQRFNMHFFTGGDSREPEQAGILSALMGSFYTMLVTLFLAFPFGISTAVYLEEFAPKNRFSSFLEVSINNLAAIPSIIFGLLGLSVFLNYLELPRSSALVGGMTLSLMTMPVVVIAARSALKSVPFSIREAAEGLGASKIQLLMHHLIPLSMPGILTGTILGLARALGESAPLLLIGMVAFIVDIPHSIHEPATVLPVQIYNWVRNPEQGFIENTAAAIIILLTFLVLMNIAAIFLRKRFEHKW